jgi:hypothetical protein
MRKIKSILFATLLVASMSSFTLINAVVGSVCSCGSPAGGTQTFFAVAGEECCSDPVDEDHQATIISYKPGDKKGTYIIESIKLISNATGQQNCCEGSA